MQCDFCTAGTANSLGDVGFSQLVMTRKFTIEQFPTIRMQVDRLLKYFFKGTLCAAFSSSAVSCMRTHAATPMAATIPKPGGRRKP
jgi:collagenase-like PrtC family protease